MNKVNRAIASDALRAMANNRFEQSPRGIFVPGANVHIGGVLTGMYAAPGEEDFSQKVVALNRVVATGLNKLLNLLVNQASYGALYLAPFSGDVTPADGWTGATFPSTATEFTSYTAGTRPAWTSPASTAKLLTNAASLAGATITFSPGGPYTVRGCGLLESSGKGSTTGMLFAAARFPDDLTGMVGGGKLALQYDLGAIDEGDA